MRFFQIYLFFVLIIIEQTSTEILFKSIVIKSNDTEVLSVPVTKWKNKSFSVTLDFKKPTNDILVKKTLIELWKKFDFQYFILD